MVWLRDVGLVAVDKVEVTGLTGKDAAQATAALEAVGRDSTTLHVDRAAIDGVAERFPIIHSVRIETDFPDGLRIAVTEQRPAAMLVAGSRRIPVAARRGRAHRADAQGVAAHDQGRAGQRAGQAADAAAPPWTPSAWRAARRRS